MRDKHTFQFQADQIAKAAKIEAEYHRQRNLFWGAELEKAVAVVKKTARIEVKEFAITGGVRFDVAVEYGDPSAYRRMQEASEKAYRHRQACERFETDARIYGTQDRVYELSTEDVHYYRLGGGERTD